ncbi:hypothetical protein HJFPF1_08733 [Paramyrothecium foliicola]|nr:hypothetical protein HJFPF1_08733 [Paramyrothecium foliicola]
MLLRSFTGGPEHVGITSLSDGLQSETKEELDYAGSGWFESDFDNYCGEDPATARRMALRPLFRLWLAALHGLRGEDLFFYQHYDNPICFEFHQSMLSMFVFEVLSVDEAHIARRMNSIYNHIYRVIKHKALVFVTGTGTTMSKRSLGSGAEDGWSQQDEDGTITASHLPSHTHLGLSGFTTASPSAVDTEELTNSLPEIAAHLSMEVRPFSNYVQAGKRLIAAAHGNLGLVIFPPYKIGAYSFNKLCSRKLSFRVYRSSATYFLRTCGSVLLGRARGSSGIHEQESVSTDLHRLSSHGKDLSNFGADNFKALAQWHKISRRMTTQSILIPLIKELCLALRQSIGRPTFRGNLGKSVPRATYDRQAS